MRGVFALVFLASGFGCHLEEPEVETQNHAIVGGETHTDHPAIVLIDLGGGLCTGTLISPRVVLTAAHCLTGEVASIRVMFVNAMAETGESIRAVSYENKPNTDLGAITLVSDGPVAPIPANPNFLEGREGQPVQIIGFGVTGETNSDSGLKRMGMASLNALSGDGIDAGELTTTNDPQGTCYGDSGGPNLMTIDGVELVAGVTSRGTNVCGAGLDVAVRVDSHIEWIRSYIGANDAGECSADMRCAQGCATVDVDCCEADGACTDECGDLDPDCGVAEVPGSETDPDAVGANASAGCATAPGGGSGSVWWMLLLVGVFVSVRTRRQIRR